MTRVRVGPKVRREPESPSVDAVRPAGRPVTPARRDRSDGALPGPHRGIHDRDVNDWFGRSAPKRAYRVGRSHGSVDDSVNPCGRGLLTGAQQASYWKFRIGCDLREADMDGQPEPTPADADPFLFEPVPMPSRAMAGQREMLADSCGCLCNTVECGCTSYCYCNAGGCSCRMVLV
jgi:hypothetical protein